MSAVHTTDRRRAAPMATASGSLVARMLGAARLDAATYGQVARDPTATGQAAAVVALATVAAAIGSWADSSAVELAAVLLVGPVLWIVFALATGFVGTRLAPAPPGTGLGALLRALGFAETPGLLAVLGAVPAVGPVVAGLAGAWAFAAAVVAVRQVLGTGVARAVAAVVLGLLLGVVAWALLVGLVSLAAAALVRGGCGGGRGRGGGRGGELRPDRRLGQQRDGRDAGTGQGADAGGGPAGHRGDLPRLPNEGCTNLRIFGCAPGTGGMLVVSGSKRTSGPRTSS